MANSAMRSSRLARRARDIVLGLACAVLAVSGGYAHASDSERMSQIARTAAVDLGGAGLLHYYIAYRPSGDIPRRQEVVSALIAIHGHPRDANRTLGAAALAAEQAGRDADTVVVAPLFQVATAEDDRCHYRGNPKAHGDDVLWTCESWIGGERAEGGGPTSFAALDRLVAQLVEQWPRLRTVTVAGFSAGAQYVQRYIGFARPPEGVRLRYVVSDPGTWLYFDPQRPVPTIGGHSVDWSQCRDVACEFDWQPGGADCANANQWKYGTDNLPAALGSSPAQARERYAAADVAYLEGGRDAGQGHDTFYRILDKSCAAELQGPDRLTRGRGYAAYDRRFLSDRHRLTVVPDCAHEVTCVFPSAAAGPALFPE